MCEGGVCVKVVYVCRWCMCEGGVCVKVVYV